MDRKTSTRANAREVQAAAPAAPMAAAVPAAAPAALPPSLQALAAGALEAHGQLWHWMEQTQAGQFGALKTLSAALQSGLEAAGRARDLHDLAATQLLLLETALSVLSQAQIDAFNGWVALQTAWARQWPRQLADVAQELAASVPMAAPAVAEGGELGAAMDRARTAFDEATREWNAFWTRQGQRPMASS